jgi:methylase of polypeptide subunit release factors
MIQATQEYLDFAGLTITYDARVLTPRPWTVAQSRWAAELLRELPEGPVLELCSGAGQIGLAAVAGTTRRLVCVDANPAAIALTQLNAHAAGLTDVETRHTRLQDALRTHEVFPLILADPPWVETARVHTYPQDPVLAIDGGADGLVLARDCWSLVEQHLAPAGTALLQLGSVKQVAALVSLGRGELRCMEVREFDGGVVARLGHNSMV